MLIFSIEIDVGSTSNDYSRIISDQQPIEDGTYKNEFKWTHSQKYYAALSEEKKEILQKNIRIAYKKRKLCNMTGTKARPSIDTIP